jgi:hypothetical protein
MAFPLEIIVSQAPELASVKMKEYVKRVHDRYVRPISFIDSGVHSELGQRTNV